MKWLGLALIAGLTLAGCEEQKPERIQWQLPLQADEDPHGAHADQGEVPQWAARRQGVATLLWLEKATARVHTLNLATGQRAKLDAFDVRLLGFAAGLQVTSSGAFLDDENVDNPAAFVEVSRNGETVYRGWLYAKFPELFGIDDSGWKVWLKGINLRPAPTEGETDNTMHP